MLIIFNETTTLKIKLVPSNLSHSSLNSAEDLLHENKRKSSIVSLSNIDECKNIMNENGRYRILKMKSLLRFRK
jgi:hypothetical protein